MIHALPGMGAHRRMYPAPWPTLPGFIAHDWVRHSGEKSLAELARSMSDASGIRPTSPEMKQKPPGCFYRRGASAQSAQEKPRRQQGVSTWSASQNCFPDNSRAVFDRWNVRPKSLCCLRMSTKAIVAGVVHSEEFVEPEPKETEPSASQK